MSLEGDRWAKMFHLLDSWVEILKRLQNQIEVESSPKTNTDDMKEVGGKFGVNICMRIFGHIGLGVYRLRLSRLLLWKILPQGKVFEFKNRNVLLCWDRI